MRLIDADALIESAKDYPFVQHALKAQTGKMPTVDAIPVEFIEEEINTLDEIVHDILAEKSESNLPAEIWLAFRSALKTLIERWDEDTERSDLS